MKKLFLFLLITVGLVYFSGASAAIDIPSAGVDEFNKVSLSVGTTDDTVTNINIVGIEILRIIKRILMGLMVIYMVYVGAMMIMSMGSDEEQLSSAKRQIWYAIIALVFINIPGSIYSLFTRNNTTTIGSKTSTNSFEQNSSESGGNILIDFTQLDLTQNGGVVSSIVFFLEMMVFLAAVAMLIITGIKVLTSRGREESIKEAKNKITYTILALIFVGIIEAWKRIAFGGVIEDGVDLFGSLLNLALFFAVPVAIFFLTLAAYYFITANGDEERVKKAKSIIVNTLLGTLILLAGYTFLLDLAGLTL